MEISSLGALRQYQSAQEALKPETTTTTNTSDKDSALAKGVEEFSEVFKAVEQSVQGLASGQADAHSVVEAMANAELALETAVTVRNRVVEAYQELLRMPV
ncbi:MAG: flagellar hook-basal body complex protein FliE [Robiginitomaculum sp.]|nr:flagellar hook-basal body complex protein FliE [Robiginitomaculum sp.]